MRAFGYALGGEGSTMYRTSAGDFFVYPTDNARWMVIWEPTIQSHRFNDMVARLPTRRDAIEWIEAALSFA
jgi:hypothetical protein